MKQSAIWAGVFAVVASVVTIACGTERSGPTGPETSTKNELSIQCTGGACQCNVALTRLSPNPQVVTHNTSGHNVSWHIINNGTSAITLTGETLTKKGNVTAVHSGNWAPFPHTLAAGSRIDADLTYDVGAAGSGSVSMNVSSTPCGTLSLPGYSVTIQ